MDGDRDTGFSVDLNGPARVGAELRGMRERLGWSLDAIAIRLKIKLGFLEAIEAGDLAALPAPIYAAGFIRSYAEALGLDPEEILRRFRAGGMTPPKQPVLTFPEPVPERGVPPGAVALLVAVIAICLYVVWYRHSEQRIRMADAIPPVPAKFASLALPKASPAPHPAAKPAAKSKPAHTAVANKVAANPAAAAPATASPPPAAVKPAVPDVSSGTSPGTVSATDTPATVTAAISAASAAPATAPVAARVATARPDAGIEPPAASAGPAPPPSSTDESGTDKSGADANAAPSPALAVSASATSWVEIRDAAGTILFSRVLKPGQSWPLPDEPGLTLTTGNAGGTELLKNGTAGPPVGKPGAVIHNAPIMPSGTIGPAPPSQPSISYRLQQRPTYQRQTYQHQTYQHQTYQHQVYQNPAYRHRTESQEPVDPFAISTKGYQ